MRITHFTGLLLLLLSCAVPVVAAQDTAERAQQARQELKTLRARIDQVRTAISKGNQRHDELTDKLTRTEQAIDQASRKLDTLKQAIDHHKKNMAQLERKRDREKAYLGDTLDTLKAQLRAAYRTGRISKLRLLLSGQPPDRVGRMLAYYDYFARAQSQQAKQLRKRLSTLADRQTALATERRQLDARRAQRAALLDQLKETRSQRQNTIAALDHKLSQHKATLEDYRHDAEQLEVLLERLHEKLKQTEPTTSPEQFTALKGHMTPPVSGRILARFGSGKANGRLRWHGQWRAASRDTPVKAVADGRVVYVGYMHHYGLIVVLEHAGVYFTVYGHISNSTVTEGDRVSRGQTIAHAGTSGGYDRSGVYFEIRKGRTPLDPADWLGG